MCAALPQKKLIRYVFSHVWIKLIGNQFSRTTYDYNQIMERNSPKLTAQKFFTVRSDAI